MRLNFLEERNNQKYLFLLVGLLNLLQWSGTKKISMI